MSATYKEHCEESWTNVRNLIKFPTATMYMGPEGYNEVEQVHSDVENCLRAYRISQHETMRSNFFVVETKTYGGDGTMRMIYKDSIKDVKLEIADTTKKRRVIITCVTKTSWTRGPESAALEYVFLFSDEESAFAFMIDIMYMM